MTTRINLRDWRRERRELRKKQFVQMLGLGVIAAVAVVGASWAAMNGALDNQQARNQRLAGEIKEMDKKNKEIGRGECRERGGQVVEIMVGVETLKKKTDTKR